jgi:hypothetical protein
MFIRAFLSTGDWAVDPDTYTPPQATFDIWAEWWMPVGYFGGR